MSPRARKIVVEQIAPPQLPRLNKHLVMGYVFLLLVFFGAVSSVYYWEYKSKVGASGSEWQVGSGEQSSADNTKRVIDAVIPNVLSAEACPTGYSKTGFDPKTGLPEPGGGLEQCEKLEEN